MVKIEPSDESEKVYKMTFKNNIKPGAEYKIHIYFIAPKGVNIYKGENGAIIFKAKQNMIRQFMNRKEFKKNQIIAFV